MSGIQQVKVHLRNCYGIGELSCEFDFSKCRVHAVYAPNGFMKTSFARTLADLSRGEASRDQVFPSRTTERLVDDEYGPLTPQQVFVVPPYEESYQSQNVSTLLVDASLKSQYEASITAVQQRKDALLNALKQRSGLKKRGMTPESELCRVLEVRSLLDAIDALVELADSANTSLADVPYSVLFDQKPLEFLLSEDATTQLADYVRYFDDLVSKSPILTARFNHTQAGTLHKALQDSRFFDAQHWVVLNNGGQPLEIRDAKALRQRVDDELNRILHDPQLRKTFDALDKKVAANAELRDLREYLHTHKEILPLLANPQQLRRDVWGAYLASEKTLLAELHSQFASSRSTIETVVAQAKAQATEWSEVVEIFNDRFSVPFRLRVENQDDVILRNEAPRVAFDFHDGGDSQQIDTSKELLQALSQGERRALYLLNVMFELRAKQKEGTPVLVVVDDIADSFDYRNKYAIIEYLQEVARSDVFRLIILTHNFDFHRSVAGRLGILRANRRLAVRSGRTVSLEDELYQKNPLKAWTKEPTNPTRFLASVPFVRNLAEYCGHEDVLDALTQVLHLKARTANMTLADLDEQYKKVVVDYRTPDKVDRSTRVINLLQETAAGIAAAKAEHVELEEKVVLSMAIRLKAEEHMIEMLADPTFVDGIPSNQTCVLLEEYRAKFADNRDQLRVLERVQLMTPENIHLNSFMFEPILDLGIVHLRRLYEDVAAL